MNIYSVRFYEKKRKRLLREHLFALTEELTQILKELSSTSSVRIKIARLHERLDFYTLLYSNYSTLAIVSSIQEIRAALRAYWNDYKTKRVYESFDLFFAELLQTTRSRYEQGEFKSTVSKRYNFISFSYDGLLFISQFESIVSKARCNKDSIVFLDREYNILYPTKRRTKANFYIIADLDQKTCFPASHLLQKFSSNSKQFLEKSTQKTVKYYMFNKVTGVFRYHGRQLYTLSPHKELITNSRET